MKTTTIEETCSIHARIGWQGLTKKEYLDDGDYYLVTGVDFERGHIAFENCHYVTKDRYEQDPHIQIDVNDILVTKDGTIGKVAIIESPIDKPATLNSGVFVVRPKDTASLLPKYLMCVLQSNLFTRFIEGIKVGCTIAHLNQEKFLKFSFPLPSTDEQRKIIRIFDSISSAIYLRQTQVKTYDDLIKARFVEMFGNNRSKIPLSDYCDVSGGYSFKSGDITTDGAIRILQIGNVSLNDVNWDTTNYLPQGYDDKYSRFLLNEGDIVVALTRPIIQSLGNVKACIIKAIDTPCLLNQRVGRITSKKDMNNDLKYIFGCLMTEDFTRYVESCCVGCSQPNISTKDIENFMIPAATSNEQKEYVRFSEQVDKSKSIVQKSLDEAQLLFDSLMQKYFG